MEVHRKCIHIYPVVRSVNTVGGKTLSTFLEEEKKLVTTNASLLEHWKKPETLVTGFLNS